MATAKQIVELAVREIGIKDSLPNSNLTSYGKE